MASLNKVFLIGRLTRDPELRRIPSGAAVTECSLAANRYYNDPSGERKEETSFVDVVIWGKKAETFSEYMTKGEEVLIVGRLKQDRWTTDDNQNRSKIRIICENFQFLSKKGARSGGVSNASDQSKDDNLDSDFEDPGAVPF